MSTMPNPFQLLELHVISAQDLAQVSRKMKLYAVAWVHPDRKLSTRVDTNGHNNPTWNDKFVFRVDDPFLHGDTSAVMIEIYMVHWFRDIHIGTVRVIVGSLICQTDRTRHKHRHQLDMGMKFVALQVRRRSGRPQGILNIGVSLLNSSMRSMPLYTQLSTSAIGFSHLMGDDDHIHHHQNKEDYDNDFNNTKPNNQLLLPWLPKPKLRRTQSDSSSMLILMNVARKPNYKPSKKASSMVSASELEEIKQSDKWTYKGKSKASSMISALVLIKRKSLYNQNKKDSGVILNKSNHNGFTRNKYGSETDNDDDNNNNSQVIIRKMPTPTHSELSHNKYIHYHNNHHAMDIVVANSYPKNENNYAWKGPNKVNKNASRRMITDSDSGLSLSEKMGTTTKVKYNNNYRVEETMSGGAWSMEGLQSKLERWKAELPPVYNQREQPTTSNSDVVIKGHSRRHHRKLLDVSIDDEDGDLGGDHDGSFTCFGRICGLECSIICGGPPSRRVAYSKSKRRSSQVRRSPSTVDFSFL